MDAPQETPRDINIDVVIIGAGPSGAIAASLLHQQGKQVLVLEKQHFPRFSIGESLLPYCMQFIEQAGMLEAVEQAGFQFKNGAAFRHNGTYTTFDFTEKFTQGPGTTFQVQRGQFDKLLADTAVSQGVEIRYGHQVNDIDLGQNASSTSILTVTDEHDSVYRVTAKYVLDASGFGRVLPRLLHLEKPSNLPARSAIFTHIEDNITDASFDREKILISVHPSQKDIWYWLIPFSDGRCSVGVVAEPHLIEHCQGDLEEQLWQLLNEEPGLKALLSNAKVLQPCASLRGYSANVSTLATSQFALLGNAGEFLDPVFSSGVTIAMQSASMAVETLIKQLDGKEVDWQQDYAEPLMQGVNTFRTYVQAWYDGRFQDVIFYDDPNPTIKQMICSILAGYAWDTNNPFVKDSERRLNMIVDLCRDHNKAS
ncbi:NAD(P)/FAD-dependent oxidoreductase [Shewanella sp. 1_MG-2023]|uniref:NAD(P)/FAD-dependent oxidoreductase n=1 Tax=unclassified Shewanella TaxID=196818 RepID=UPI000C81C827|nr:MULTISPECIES: NAD(P)/FAD-dependent oxidoreductase [unclassified Shewanella]MDO6612948.1 NAD(P)/FAD-dependent oxidoreductase [Shewanella sp. 7_MG-2023]MDO6772872.1 NAD(P)/FAD-dependent oxidoreductase [Shewanella sp. 2_MG-2023]MDO6795080.1 NAD(P)/FAD-dependent oxidoreductase [Shewanella sp. 1_MG-2023]PMG79066.1 FAD-dependent oxidoreductase [Shewanella sp. 10N.286.51.B7]